MAELVLIRALPIDRRDNFQPSGLVWHEGKLLTVSDKHENEIFELVLEEQRVAVNSYRRFSLPAGIVELDLEGLCSDGAGGLLLASEAQVRVLRLASDATLSWATPALDRLGAAVGLFALPNAKLEGIARLADGRIVLAAERSERGLIELPADGEISRALAWSMPMTPFTLPLGRAPDFSDLASFEDELFALVRGAHLVVKLERSRTEWVEGAAWSFAATENDDRFGYVDRRYGVAEGLALDGNRVYLVFDNNGDARSSAPGDVRPQLLIFERPSR
ncbi:MAG TPA: esterase-like activity of phytase family protein [Polyangiaceae bacterium]|nr:esterase-like activity of phytase family protein [Polyangiaceae bacterium]